LVYLVYLADADRDTATFAVFTYPVHQVNDRQEDRAPSLVSLETANVAMCALGKPCPEIATREQLDRWLAGRSGWAAIRPEAAQLVPHWLGEAVEHACTMFRLGSVEFEEPSYMWTVEFVESTCLVDATTSFVPFDLAGPPPDDERFAWFKHITSNLVASKRPLP